ncbi:MAG: hypothetical protein ACRDYX_04870 [Egibacteraceae bacterium]
MADDGLISTFKLHRDVQWHDGAPVHGGGRDAGRITLRKPPKHLLESKNVNVDVLNQNPVGRGRSNS